MLICFSKFTLVIHIVFFHRLVASQARNSQDKSHLSSVYTQGIEAVENTSSISGSAVSLVTYRCFLSCHSGTTQECYASIFDGRCQVPWLLVLLHVFLPYRIAETTIKVYSPSLMWRLISVDGQTSGRSGRMWYSYWFYIPSCQWWPF